MIVIQNALKEEEKEEEEKEKKRYHSRRNSSRTVSGFPSDRFLTVCFLALKISLTRCKISLHRLYEEALANK